MCIGIERTSKLRIRRRAFRRGPAVIRPAIPRLISSHVFSPTSLMNSTPDSGFTANVKGLRRPSAQIERLSPEATLHKTGCPRESMPSALMRNILPRRLLSVCAFEPTAFSPTATYSFPSLPKCDRAAVVIRARSAAPGRAGPSLPGSATSPLGCKAADAVVSRICRGVIHVNVSIDGEVRIEGDAEQPPLAK